MKILGQLILFFVLAVHGMAKADQFAFSYAFDNVPGGGVSSVNGIFEGTANGDLISITKLDYLQAGIFSFYDIAAGGVTSFSGATQSFSIDNWTVNPSFSFLFSANAAPNQSSQIDFFGVERFGSWGDAHDSPINASWTVTALAVPEPDTYLMFAAGLGVVAFWLRKRSIRNRGTAGGAKISVM